MYLLLLSGYWDKLRRHNIIMYDSLKELYGGEKGINPLLVGANSCKTMEEFIGKNNTYFDKDVNRVVALKDLRYIIIEGEVANAQ